MHPGAADICNGVDDDCDGTADEDCGCDPGESRPCGTSEGVCEEGTQQCDNGIWSECLGSVEPSDEVCDGLDNDCDGTVDEDCQGSGTPVDAGEEDSDCGCRHPGKPARWPTLLLLVGLPLMRRRRRH